MTSGYYGLPAGYHLSAGPCPDCGRLRGRADFVEGLPIYACPAGCGWATRRAVPATTQEDTSMMHVQAIPNLAVAEKSVWPEFDVPLSPKEYADARLSGDILLTTSAPPGTPVVVRESDGSGPTGRWFASRVAVTGSGTFLVAWPPDCEATVPDR